MENQENNVEVTTNEVVNETPVVEPPVTPVAEAPVAPVAETPVPQEPVVEASVQQAAPVMEAAPVQPQPVAPTPIEKKTNGFAIAGFIFSFISSIIGLILSIIGLKKSKQCNSGKGLAIAGIVISVVKIIAIILIASLFSAIIWPAVKEAITESTGEEYSQEYTKPNENEKDDDKIKEDEVAINDHDFSRFEKAGTTYYFYDVDYGYGSYAYATTTKQENTEDMTYKEFFKYQCESTCKVFNVEKDNNYTVIYDNNKYVLHNTKTKETKDLKLQNVPFSFISVTVVDNKAIGLIVEYTSNVKYEFKLERSYYDIEREKTIVGFGKYDSIIAPPAMAKAGLIAVGNSGDDYYYEYKTFNLKDGSIGDKKFGGVLAGKDVYYFYDGEDTDDVYIEALYDSNFKKLMGKADGYYITDNDELLISDGSKYYMYNKNQTLTYTSKTYQRVFNLLKDYVVVENEKNDMLVLDYKGNEKANLVKLGEDNYVHTMISGWYTYADKNGIYMIVADDTVKCDEIDEKTLLAFFSNEEDGEDNIEAARNRCNTEGESYVDEGFAYEYYYIPTTGETGKIATVVGGYAKPVLYLYPENDKTNIKVTFDKPELLTTTYPKYIREWNVVADKNGDLHDASGRYYYGLYWEEKGSNKVDYSTGFYVEKKDALKFLEEKLDIIGLTEREANEFIMYWLPILEKNEKSLVYFELTEERDSYNTINISPRPDSILRMAIHVKKVNKKTNIKEEKLTSFKRKGFTAVEWGGVSE